MFINVLHLVFHCSSMVHYEKIYVPDQSDCLRPFLAKGLPIKLKGSKYLIIILYLTTVPKSQLVATNKCDSLIGSRPI